MLYALRGRTTWSHSSNDIPIAAPGQTMKIGDLDSSATSRGRQTEKEMHDQYFNHLADDDASMWRSKVTTSSSMTPPSTRHWLGPDMNTSHRSVFEVHQSELRPDHDIITPELEDRIISISSQPPPPARSPYRGMRTSSSHGSNPHSVDERTHTPRPWQVTPPHPQSQSHSHSHSQQSVAWGESPRSPPRTPIGPAPPAWYGRAY